MGVLEQIRPADCARTGGTGRCHAARPDRYRIDVFDPALLHYLRACFAAARHEELRVIYCDASRHYLFDETRSIGASDRLVARMRPLFERALAIGAGGLLLAHNHPSGNCHPSATDIRSTRMLRDIGAALEIEVIDHLIFTRSRCLSMASGGYL